ncbi:beta-ketoacyl-ACP reductase [Buchnera aphidicola (Formosaphis micheliae)]|uniref:beta-ketoacyl-ACP reductase n=1 Tax=Buchnera aphidicola TaxID=9 RepID=UPI0031B805B3
MNRQKIAIVTGASRGIGLDILKKLIRKNIFVIGTSTTKNGMNKINYYLKNKGIGIILDVNDYLSINTSIKKIYEQYKFIDILINNAGINRDKLLINMTTIDWEDVLRINLTGVFHMSKEILYTMIKRRYGRIITIGSVVGHIGNPGQTNYSAAKSGLIGFHKSLALEVASFGITVNIISPGFIKTDMTNSINKKKYDNYISKIPMKRFGQVNDISSAVLFFISNQASYITGQVLHINGGMYMN